MVARSAFHLDCTPIIPECGFKCAKCLQEIESVFTKMQGVNKVYTEGKGQDMKLIVEHDASMVVEELIEAFSHLPSFYKGFFVPTVLES